MGNDLKFAVLAVVLTASLGAQARTLSKESVPKRLARYAAKVLGCEKYFVSTSPLNDQVAQFVRDHAEHTTISIDPDDQSIRHVRAHIYPKKYFNCDNVCGDATDEFNFYVSEGEIIIRSLDSVLSNRAFRIITHLPEHFPYARISGTAVSFDIEYFSTFIEEIEKIGFAFY